MKTHMLKLMVLFLCGLTVMSCKKDTDLNNGDEIQLEDISLNFNNGGQSQLLEIPINEKSNGWHIYSPSQDIWLTQEIIPGRSSIYVYVDGNTSGEARSSYIVIRSKNYTQKINVQQDSEGGINLSQTYVPVRYLNSTAVVNITNFDELTDITVTAEEGTQGWLSIFTENEKINLHATINDLTSPREALITVSAKRKISGETVTSFINLYQGRGGMTPYVFDIPDFSASNVYKVMDGSKQVAQITKEFLRAVGQVNAQAIVVYPVENDVVAINKGYIAQIVLENTDLVDNATTAQYLYKAPTGAIHGGTVSFSIADNNISGYVAGTLAVPVTRIYMPGDVGMGPEEIPSSVTATVEPHLIVDVRNTESNTYPVVKIGAQYWMGKNLNTTYYRNGTPISTNATAEAARLAGNYSIYGFADGASTDPLAVLRRVRYGLHYNYLAIGGFDTPASANLSSDGQNITDNLSPEGWLVPTYAELTQLRDYIRGLTRLRRFVQPFTTEEDAQGIVTKEQWILDANTRHDDNITGFAGINASYRATNGNFENLTDPNRLWLWSRTFTTLGASATTHTAKAVNAGGLQNAQQAVRSMSIRSLNKDAIKLADN